METDNFQSCFHYVFQIFDQVQSTAAVGNGRLRATIFESADTTAHLIMSPKLHNDIRCTVLSADLKMAARNRPLAVGLINP